MFITINPVESSEGRPNLIQGKNIIY